MKEDDFSEDHLEWLVERRSDNQRLSLELFKLLKAHPNALRKPDCEDGNIAQGLIAVCFSLWRAVFLSDNQATTASLMDDGERFLGKLITDNAVAYPLDRLAREWTFIYYVNSARYRLEEIQRKWPSILPAGSIERTVEAKEYWTQCHEVAELAVQNLRKSLDTLQEIRRSFD